MCFFYEVFHLKHCQIYWQKTVNGILQHILISVWFVMMTPLSFVILLVCLCLCFFSSCLKTVLIAQKAYFKIWWFFSLQLILFLFHSFILLSKTCPLLIFLWFNILVTFCLLKMDFHVFSLLICAFITIFFSLVTLKTAFNDSSKVCESYIFILLT